MQWGRYGRVAARPKDKEGVLREGDEVTQRLGALLLQDWRCLLGKLLNVWECQRGATSCFVVGVLQSSNAT